MAKIELLSQDTIDKIAAGEVVERPSSVVKELVENSLDAGANAITVEIKEGGISFIRISDNGSGIEKSDLRLAFLRHSTSKIQSVEDLFTVSSLGFRGEALSSIAAVSQVELITKTRAEFTGSRYRIEGSKEVSCEEIGAPDGTTLIVRNLFYNTPARKKFLKSAQTEGNYIHELMQRLILSHPEVSFKFIMNGQVRLQSSGNSNVKDIIYHIYGRDITRELLSFEHTTEQFTVSGFLGKPQISRGNRNYEIYFINGRFIRNKIIAKAIEDAYKPYVMQHQFPMTVLYFQMDSAAMDVNVHPTKMELRFENQEAFYYILTELISDRLRHQDMIPQVPVDDGETNTNEKPVPSKEETLPEPFEVNRMAKQKLFALREEVRKDSPYEAKFSDEILQKKAEPSVPGEQPSTDASDSGKKQPFEEPAFIREDTAADSYEQQRFLDEQSMVRQKILGQLFDTYWLVEFDDKLFIVDQHAAHEKVLFERFRRQFAQKEFPSQVISPPMVISLSMREIQTLEQYMEHFTKLGFVIEPFGGSEYNVCGIPSNLYRLDPKAVLIEMLDDLTEGPGENQTPEILWDKLATMACKAAVKGNNCLSMAEMETLMKELMKLENPYHCPHGRPTIISMSKYEIEKKFKRIV
ncbi:MAG: DNA mismatch repair endonuclease MutL [Lachnospiraceae bacterium]|nr:DNA mismatch repair endonuclease MutL [Lachnospiraceae bacterium]